MFKLKPLINFFIRKPLIIPLIYSKYPSFSSQMDMKSSNPATSLKRKHSELSENSDFNDSQSQEPEKNSPNIKENNEKRLCLQGLDTFSDEKKLLKFIKSTFPAEIKFEGLIKKKGKSFAFLLFETIEDRKSFEEFLAEKKPVFKNKKLQAKPMKPNSSQTFKKIHSIDKEIAQNANKIIVPKAQDIEKELAISIQQRVCPLWKTPYAEQVAIKKNALLDILKLVNTRAKSNIKPEESLPAWAQQEKCCEMSDFIESDCDRIFNYRNKAEFTIGKNHEGLINVGFNRGNFNKGIMWVEEAAHCPITSKESLILCKTLQDFIRENQEKLPVFDRFSHEGFWRNLVIRQSDETREILLSLVVCAREIPVEELETVQKQLKSLFLSVNLENSYKIVGILMLFHNEVSDNIPYNCENVVIFGQNFYHERLLGKIFKISPDSFLQVNTPQAEKLYSLIGKLAEIDEKTVFLDICSGIGTIGLTIADKAQRILAIEMVKAACEDAEINAQANNMQNFECHCAKVEDILDETLKPFIGKSKFVAVVDPPRAGLHNSVVKKLRTCKGLDKLVYVSCNPTAMVDNLMALCLPAGKNRKGPAFSPIKAFGVDLFPLTEHYECVVLLERLYNDENI